jgi:hypothetical protein
MTTGSGNGWPGVIKVPVQKVGHDPMCPVTPFVTPAGVTERNCDCDLIAKVRADERLRTQGIIEELENHIDYLPGHTRAELRAAVEALPQPSFAATSGAVWRADVLALLDGGSDAG